MAGGQPAVNAWLIAWLIAWPAACLAPVATLTWRARARLILHVRSEMADIDRATRDCIRHAEIMRRDISADYGAALDAQRQHVQMLWPRPWQGGRPFTQVEQIVQAGETWLGDPLDPEAQHAKMMADTQALLDSYRPPQPDDDSAGGGPDHG
jgi:hypothetical protein